MTTGPALAIVRLPREGQASLSSKHSASLPTPSGPSMCYVLKRSRIQVDGSLMFHSLNPGGSHFLPHLPCEEIKAWGVQGLSLSCVVGLDALPD